MCLQHRQDPLEGKIEGRDRGRVLDFRTDGGNGTDLDGLADL